MVNERGEKGDAGQHGQMGDPGLRGEKGERGRTGAGRFALVGYLILVAGVVVSFAGTERLRQQRAEDQRRTDHIVCERSVLNARINMAQNERLTRLLTFADRGRRGDPGYPTEFDKESRETIFKARQENEELSKIAEENCSNLPTDP